MEPLEWLLFIIPIGISGLLFLTNRGAIGRKDVLDMALRLASETADIQRRLARLEGRQEERDSKSKDAIRRR